MSKYRILRVDHYDPALVGKRRRRLNIVFAFMGISAPLLLIVQQLLNIGIGIAYLILMILLSGFFLFFHLKLKSENKSFKAIGDIEFTKSGIIKRIGDSFSENSYDSIDSIELLRHIPAMTISESKSGYYTYILLIYYKDANNESIIVSDRPLGKWQDLSITETIKTLKKITPTRINIK